MGHGTVPATGLKKGAIVNIDQTVRSIADAVERAERLSGWKIDRAFVGVGGPHVESLNSTGQVAVTAHHREVTREDIDRAIEVARAVSIPSNRDVLHVERRGFTVDGQEGVKDPLGMSALRLEVETHIVSASATAVQNLTKCVPAGRRQDRRAGGQRTGLGRGGADRGREGARGRGRRHRRRHDRPRHVQRGLAVPHRGPARRRQQRHQRHRDRAPDAPAAGRGAQGPPRHLRPAQPGRRGDRHRRASARTAAARSAASSSPRSSRPGCARPSSSSGTR